MRDAANARKKELEEKHKGEAYWMASPKCGTALREELLEKIVRVDSCSNCGDTYFCHGELELLIKSQLGALVLGT